MPDRIIRDELLTSERYWSVCIEAQQLFTHLLLRADSLGRFSGKNFTIRMSCYPGHARNPAIVEKFLSDLHDADLIRLYMVDGERFIFIPRYKQKLRYTNSKYPDPPQGIDDIDPATLPDVTPTEWYAIREKVLERDGYQCIRCETKTGLTGHHMIPRANGGLSDMENLVALCKSCNSWARTNITRCNEIIELFKQKHSLSTTQAYRSEVKRSEELPSRGKRKKPVDDDPAMQIRRSTWQAYSDAYEFRHGAAPLRDAKANSAIKAFCNSVPHSEAPQVAAFYVQNSNSFYVSKKHPPTLLALDAAKLRTEWVTGQQTTQTEAIQADKTAARKNVFIPLINEANKREKST